MAQGYDVWVQSSNTIYKGVPFEVIADWAQQGRISGSDRLRAAGSEAAWIDVADEPIVSEFLFQKTPLAAVPAVGVGDAAATDLAWSRPVVDDDDDPDMIPLIDISLVLLIFFMMSTAISALSPVDVPQMKHAFRLDAAPNAITISIDRRPNGDADYSLRVGERGPEAGERGLDTLAELLQRLDARLKQLPGLPDVHIACHRELPSERVHDLVKELEARKRENKIGSYRAEVTERR